MDWQSTVGWGLQDYSRELLPMSHHCLIDSKYTDFLNYLSFSSILASKPKGKINKNKTMNFPPCRKNVPDNLKTAVIKFLLLLSSTVAISHMWI
jgi:hypothetical protein